MILNRWFLRDGCLLGRARPSRRINNHAHNRRVPKNLQPGCGDRYGERRPVRGRHPRQMDPCGGGDRSGRRRSPIGQARGRIRAGLTRVVRRAQRGPDLAQKVIAGCCDKRQRSVGSSGGGSVGWCGGWSGGRSRGRERCRCSLGRVRARACRCVGSRLDAPGTRLLTLVVHAVLGSGGCYIPPMTHKPEHHPEPACGATQRLRTSRLATAAPSLDHR